MYKHAIDNGFAHRCAQYGITDQNQVQYLMKVAMEEVAQMQKQAISAKQLNAAIGALGGAGLGAGIGGLAGGWQGAGLGALGGGLAGGLGGYYGTQYGYLPELIGGDYRMTPEEEKMYRIKIKEDPLSLMGGGAGLGGAGETSDFYEDYALLKAEEEEDAKRQAKKKTEYVNRKGLR